MRRACRIGLPLVALFEAVLISTPLLRYAELRALWRDNPEMRDPGAAMAAVTEAIRLAVEEEQMGLVQWLRDVDPRLGRPRLDEDRDLQTARNLYLEGRITTEDYEDTVDHLLRSYAQEAA